MKIIVLEANEIPPRLFRHYAKVKPNSCIANILNKTPIVETVADDVEESFLYPSQTWASLNTGLPYESHKIHWYNDPKDFKQFYWHHAACNGKKTAIACTLHSSPLGSFISEGNYCFALPDPFATTNETFPKELMPFQTLNLAVTLASGRRTNLKTLLKKAGLSWLKNPSLKNWGISKRSVASVSKMMANAFLINSERARGAQFPLVGEVFLDAIKQNKPDLAVMFTNLVAANMHRYWYGLFPQDYSIQLYPKSWVEKYKNEIMAAMNDLDAYLNELCKLALKHQYTLLLTTSMGQYANPELTLEKIARRPVDFRLENPMRFFNKICGDVAGVKFEGAMIPQYTFSFPDEVECNNKKDEIDARNKSGDFQGITIKPDAEKNKLTLSTVIEPSQSKELRIGKDNYTFKDLGFTSFKIEDHHSGKHHPMGSILLFNDHKNVFDSWAGKQINYLEYAPKIKEVFSDQNKKVFAEQA